MARSKSKTPATCTSVQMVACFLLIGQFFAIVPLIIFFHDSATAKMLLPFSFILCLDGFRGIVPNKRLCLFEAIERIVRLWKE